MKIQATLQTTWQRYLIEHILTDENPFSWQVQQPDTVVVPALIAAAQHDLRALQGLYQCSEEQLSQWVQTVTQSPAPPIIWEHPCPETPESFHQQWAATPHWDQEVDALADYYRHTGTGIFARYLAFEWREQQLLPIVDPDPIRFTELVGYEPQRETLCKNTEFLLAGYPALNVLLYGSRGSGKSSLVKSLLNQYSQEGLRLIEVAKSDLKDLSTIVQLLRNLPQKFIIFVDDLSFEEDDDLFKSLKVVLEGSVTARAKNVVVYATSNRRHLVREFFTERPRPIEQDEVHAWDTLQEKLSFSDRFGLTLTFTPADQATYLKIVQHLAQQANIELNSEELEYRALQWATQHNGRSGRTARQFIDFLQGEFSLKNHPRSTV